jgi:hypothetical protein
VLTFRAWTLIARWNLASRLTLVTKRDEKNGNHRFFHCCLKVNVLVHFTINISFSFFSVLENVLYDSSDANHKKIWTNIHSGLLIMNTAGSRGEKLKRLKVEKSIPKSLDKKTRSLAPKSSLNLDIYAPNSGFSRFLEAVLSPRITN